MIVVMIVLIFSLILAVIKWLMYFYGVCALIRYMQENNINLPSDIELKNATNWAVRNSISSIIDKLRKIF